MAFSKIRTIKRRRRLKKYFKIFLIIVLIGGLVYLVLFSNFFIAQNIEINGQDEEKVSEIQRYLDNYLATATKNYGIFKYLSTKNYLVFLLLKNEISQNLFSNYYYLDNLDFDFNFKDKEIVLNIYLKEPIATVCSLDNCFYLDSSGKLIEETVKSQKKGILIEDHSTAILKTSDDYLTPSELSVLNGFFKKTELMIKPNYVELDNASKAGKYAKIITADDYYILISFNLPLEFSYYVLQSLLNEQMIDFENLEYLDLRFTDKAFYKLK
ncbi:MAG TPA: hypothetical protein PLA57_00630 [Candidatus Paceibacterota bacterium]|nr:hypothetical protein [Candidatus Paceibacterota bacterium]HRS47703.1 hypothetical protein [Candidatus Paceibacterota bacterium]